MNISSQIFPTDGANSSHLFLFNSTDSGFKIYSLVGVITFLYGVPINSYVIWLIVTGTGNGLAAEFFSMNLAVCEILISTESLIHLIKFKYENIWILLCFLQGLAMTGRPLFQCLMCVERYLAVVHPVTFLKYKPLRYRVICSVVAWVAGFGINGTSIIFLKFSYFLLYFTLYLVLFILYLSNYLFCCLAVLRALKQSGPGERGREREKENLMKRRAFYLIVISVVTMVIIYIPYIILLYIILNSSETSGLLIAFGYVFFTSAGLVQPLLFINRVGKLTFVNCQ